jgi:DNA-directed RNA polymerase omega subunit
MTAVLTSAATAAAAIEAERMAGAATLENRFLLSSVAFLRAKQLQGGARPHLEPERHKPTHLALLEVLADTVSWSVEPPKAKIVVPAAG